MAPMHHAAAERQQQTQQDGSPRHCMEWRTGDGRTWRACRPAGRPGETGTIRKSRPAGCPTSPTASQAQSLQHCRWGRSTVDVKSQQHAFTQLKCACQAMEGSRAERSREEAQARPAGIRKASCRRSGGPPARLQPSWCTPAWCPLLLRSAARAWYCREVYRKPGSRITPPPWAELLPLLAAAAAAAAGCSRDAWRRLAALLLAVRGAVARTACRDLAAAQLGERSVAIGCSLQERPGGFRVDHKRSRGE